MPPPEPEDFDAYAKRRGWQPADTEGDDFDAYAKRRGWAPADEPEQSSGAVAAPADEAGTGEDWLDFLLGGVDGAMLGNTRNLSKLEDSPSWPLFADAISPVLGGATRVAHALAPGAQRESLEWLADLTDEAQKTPAGKAGRVVGTGATALGLGAAAGPGIAAQAALGAGLSGAEALGDTDGDWLAALEAMPVGAGFGAAGGALTSRIGVRPTPQDYGRSALLGAGFGALTSPTDPIRGAAKGAGSGLASRAVLGALPRSFGAPVRAMGQLAAAGAGTAAGALAQDVPDVAYGTAPTMAWAVQSVLSSGGTGLPPADEQRLTEAVLSGDKDRLISANFALQQRNPAYAARLQRELEALQEEED